MERKVTKIIDGDTFQVGTAVEGFYYVRLARVRAPEKNTMAGVRAKNVLRGLIGGKVVAINPVGTSYNRIVAEVFLYGRNINDVMRVKEYTRLGR